MGNWSYNPYKPISGVISYNPTYNWQRPSLYEESAGISKLILWRSLSTLLFAESNSSISKGPLILGEYTDAAYV